MTISDNVRQVAFLTAAGFIGTMLVIAAVSPAHGRPLGQPVIVTAKKDTLQERVPYNDLSLATNEGRRTLYRRVGAAVDKVCPDVDEERNAYDALGCKDFAWTGAKPQIVRAIDGAKPGASFGMAILISAAPAK
jgi:UrcA family protein